MNCEHPNEPEIVKTIVANGHMHLRKRCPDCGKLYGNPLPHHTYDESQLPFHELQPLHLKCVVKDFNSTLVELHHFMPKGIAYENGLDPDDWPVAFLCEYHHRMWHNLVTPTRL